MASDATTFFLGFLAVFGALAWGMWRIERDVRALQRRVDALATQPAPTPGTGGDPPNASRPGRGDGP